HGQLKTLRSDMRTAQRRLRGYLKKQHLVDVDQELQLLTKDVMEQEKAYKAFHAKMRGTERKLQEVQGQVDRTPAQIPYTEEFHPNPMVEQYRSRLATLEIERTQLLQGYLPTDRHVTEK